MNTLLKQLINIGWDNIEHKILYTNLSKKEAEELEIKLIKEYKSNDRSYGYNIDNGGNSIGKHNEETKIKISKSQKKRLEKTNLNSKQLSVLRQYAFKSKKIGMYSLDNELINVYNSLSEVKDKLNIPTLAHISECCKGKRNKAYGYIWRYLEEAN